MKKSAKIKIIVAVALFLFLICIMVYRMNTRESSTTHYVKVDGVSKVTSFDTDYSTTGNLQLCNNNIHAITVQYNAVVVDVYVENGEKVEDGQQLLKVKRLTDNVEEVINSDLSGVVKFSKDVHIGTIFSQFTTIMTVNELNDAEDFYVKVQVPSSVYDNMNAVTSADVTFPDVLSPINLGGKLSDISITAEQKSNVEYYNFLVKVDDSDELLQDYNLIDGMSLNVTLHSKNEIDAKPEELEVCFEVPFSSVVIRDDKNVLFVYQRQGGEFTAKMVIVDLINTNGDTAIIKVKGTSLITDSTEVITEGNSDLSGSEKVVAQ